MESEQKGSYSLGDAVGGEREHDGEPIVMVGERFGIGADSFGVAAVGGIAGFQEGE